MVYQYKWKIPKYPVDSQIVGEHFEKLCEEHGEVTSKNLLESARPKDSCVHDCFEWNDGIAAEKYRLSQASDMITNLVKVAMIENEEKQKTYPAFVNVSEKHTETGSYISTEVALSNEKTRRIVLNRALTELKIFKKKYSDLNELSGVFNAIDTALQDNLEQG